MRHQICIRAIESLSCFSFLSLSLFLSGGSVKCVREYDGVCGWSARLYLWDVAYDLFIPLYFAPFSPIHRVIACLIFADSDKLYALKMTIDYA